MGHSSSQSRRSPHLLVGRDLFTMPSHWDLLWGLHNWDKCRKCNDGIALVLEKSVYLWLAYLGKWSGKKQQQQKKTKKESFDAERKIGWWEVEIEDYSERLSRWAVSTLKCPRMVLLLALPWIFHFCRHFQVISQGDIFEKPYDSAGMWVLGKPSGWPRACRCWRWAERVENSREGCWTRWPRLWNPRALLFVSNFGVWPVKDSPVSHFCRAGAGNCYFLLSSDFKSLSVGDVQP